MKNETNNKVNMLMQELHIADEPHSALRMADSLYREVETCMYKNMSRREALTFLENAHKLQNEKGFVPLFVSDDMPRDARVDLIYLPTYAISAVAIHALLNWPDAFEGELGCFLHGMLESAYGYGIIGHGFEAAGTARRTLLMLCRAGVRKFIEVYGHKYPFFKERILGYMNEAAELGRKIENGSGTYVEDAFSEGHANYLNQELWACWEGKNNPVFVYGTLMKGQSARHMLDTSIYGGKFLLRDYALYDLGAYPGIKARKGESVCGELYFVDDKVLAEIDIYECLGTLYDRVDVELSIGYRSFGAEAYVYKGSVANSEMVRTRWNADASELVWYAAYGSNLSEERFDCYITGGLCKENGREYSGCKDKTPPREIRTASYPGKLSFGNSSGSWGGRGVAFFYPTENSEESGVVYMKLYKISLGQLLDIQKQEGMSANWYGRLLCLGNDGAGVPVYTFTSETPRLYNAPSEVYKKLISGVLEKDFRLSKRQIEGYLNRK